MMRINFRSSISLDLAVHKGVKSQGSCETLFTSMCACEIQQRTHNKDASGTKALPQYSE